MREAEKGIPARNPRRRSLSSRRNPIQVIVNVEASPATDEREIAELAYSYWEARGSQGGSPEDDWLRAERELKNRSPRISHR